MERELTNQTTRRFDDKHGRWWTVSWRESNESTRAPSGFVFRPADGGEELFFEAAPGAGPDTLTRLSLGDVRQILSVARSGLV